MKMLDEIITELKTIYDRYEAEGCFYCSFRRECIGSYCYLADALHYLKEYKNTDENYKKAITHVTEVIDHYEKMVADYLSVNNPALTWDELKTMEGKPVWVEYNFQISDKKYRDNSKRWCVIREFEYWHDAEVIITDNGFVLSKNEQVTDWQAYRKEKRS